MGDERQGKPFAVGRPLIVEAVVVGLVMLSAIRDLAHLFGGYVIDFQNVTDVAYIVASVINEDE